MSTDSEHPTNEEPHDLPEVSLGFETMRQLQSGLAPMLSNDGLFIATDKPRPADTVLRFRVTLPDDFVLIEGTGVVIWNRFPGSPDGPAGMAVRYASLGSEAQETIDAIIDAHLASGGELFDLIGGTPDRATYPTDGLGADAAPPPTDPNATTAQELAKARLTIRDEGEGKESPEKKPEVRDSSDSYLEAVEADMEKAVAGLEPQPGAATGSEAAAEAPDAAAEQASLQAAAIERELEKTPSIPLMARAAEDGQPPQLEDVELAAATDWPPPPEVEPAAEGPAEPDVPTDPAVAPPGTTVDERLELEADVPPDEPAAEPGAPSTDGPEADRPTPEGAAEGEGVESLIPMFLERWKEEVGRADGSPPVESETPLEAAETPPVAPPPEPVLPEERAPVEISESPADEVETRDEPAAEPEPASPMPRELERRESRSEELAPEFEVSIVDREVEPDPTPVRDSEERQPEVTLVPPDSSSARGKRGGRKWLGLLVLLPIVAVAGLLYWQWDRLRPGPAAEIVAEPEPRAAPVEPAASEEAVEVEDSEAARSEPEPAPAAEPPAIAPSGPATEVEEISWRERGGGTEVLIRGNGVIANEAVTVFPMSDPPRILIRLRRIGEKYHLYEIPVGTGEVDRIRIGHHPEQNPPALYVVLDVTGPGVAADATADGDTVRVTARR